MRFTGDGESANYAKSAGRGKKGDEEAQITTEKEEGDITPCIFTQDAIWMLYISNISVCIMCKLI